MNSRSVLKIRHWIRSWERRGYPDGIPDEAPAVLEELGRVPSYRMVCEAIMRNDHTLQMLGFSRPKCQVYMDLKRAELLARGKMLDARECQIRLF